MLLNAASPTLPNGFDSRQGIVPINTVDMTGADAPEPVRYLTDFTEIVLLKVKGKTIYTHRDILMKNSDYFRTKLKGQFHGGFRRSINLQDVQPDCLTEYLQFLQKSVYTRPLELTTDQSLYPLVKLLNLWTVAFRLWDRGSLAIVRVSLGQRWETMSVEGWYGLYLSTPDAGLKERVLHLQEAYKLCKDRFIPFEQNVVTACANCPPQVFANVFAGLELGAEFRARVTKVFALRHVDPELTKKRKSAEEQSPMTPEKMRRLERK